MTYEFELSGEKYKLEGNPTLGTVREVQSMQTDLLMDYLDEDDLRNLDSLGDEEEIVECIIDEGGFEAFEDVQWQRSMLEVRQTISLAADNAFSPDDFDKMPSQNFEQIKEEAEDALGGDANDFFKRLGIGTSLSAEQMNQVR